MEHPKGIIKGAIVYLTNDCNLNCLYCFVKKNKKRMSYQTGKATIDFMLGQAKGIKEIHISFFGGEPLLEFKLMKKLIEYGKNQAEVYKKNIRFGVTTNGTLFTKQIIDFFKKNNIGILFSFEGDKKRIIGIKGNEVYEKKIWAINKLKKMGFKITARVTLEPCDLRLVDFTKHLLGLGFKGIAFLPVSPPGKSKKWIDGWDQNKTDDAFRELAEYYIKEARRGNILELHYITKLLKIKHGVQRLSTSPCDVGKGLVGITVDGLILPCHHPEAWLPNYILGNVFDKKIDNKKRAIFLKHQQFQKPIECQTCSAKEYCAGWCAVVSYRHTGDMFHPIKNYCIFIRARARSVDYIYKTLVLKEKNKYLLEKLNPLALNLDNLDKFKSRDGLNRIFFDLQENNLNRETGKKIINFLKNLKQKEINFEITKPLPRCLFGSDYNKITKEFNIPKNYKKYKKENKKLVKCKDCIYRSRKQCNGI